MTAMNCGLVHGAMMAGPSTVLYVLPHHVNQRSSSQLGLPTQPWSITDQVPHLLILCAMSANGGIHQKYFGHRVIDWNKTTNGHALTPITAYREETTGDW